MMPEDALRVVISDFGPGPYAGWQGSEAIFQALSGVGYLTGLPDEPPLLGIGERSRYSAGVAVAINVLSLLLTDRPDVSQARLGVAEIVTQIQGVFTAARHAFNGTHQDRHEFGGLVSMIECQDEWLVLYAARPADWYGCCHVFGVMDHVEDARFVGLGARFENWDEATALLREAAASLTVAAGFLRAREVKLPLSLVHSATTLWNDPHLRGRAVWSNDAVGSDLTLTSPYIFDDDYAGRALNHDRSR